ncbi:MAG: carboxypeptidase-like regulatory domain-containing protein [Bacteroidota bacterium]|nr:carboxypeptidase-like regulatory domain-containing protein [Bacteroidota bacterium]
MKFRNSPQLSIPAPCSVKWEEMGRVNEGSRHCSSCKKVIVDFTKMSDDELVAFFHKNKNACGKLSKRQLDRDLKIDRTSARTGAWKNIFMIPALFLGMETFAREKTNISESMSNVHFRFEITSGNNALPTPANNPANDTLVIKGIVLDSLTGEAMVGAVVLIDSLKIGAVTDFDGNFSLKIPHPLDTGAVQLTVRYTGYPIIIKNVEASNTPVTIWLTQNEPTDAMIGIIVSTPRMKVRHFFYRLFHPRSW